MGDTSVDFFLETLKELIASSKLDSIIQEKHQLQSLEEEIKYLRGFLKDTEKKRNEHREVKELVMEIRDVVSEAENIVERFVIDAFKADHRTSRTKKRKAKDGLSLELEFVKDDIKTLKPKVKQIYKNIIQSSTRSGGSSSAGGSNTSKVVKEKVVVGFDDEVQTLLEKLEDRGEGRLLEIITIIGAGGGGKTTLAKEVYHHPLTSHNFEIQAWVDVSQDYNNTTMKRDLLIRVLKSAFPQNQDDYESTEDMLGEKLFRYLKGRKYLIVMDDIWGIEAWNDIQRSFPKERNGSKVLFTSRQLIQLDSVHLVPHYLDPLPKHKSWELLQKKVFGTNCCPPELENIGMKIAEKCEGLPLAIVTIAGILATVDKTLDAWEEVAKHLSSIIAEDKEGSFMKILELSYNHLPLHLKACFLYIGAFPKDSEIRVRELLWLWIAEGFIQPSDRGGTLEDIAKGHLIDLINRSLVMVTRKSSLRGIKACRIHDLLRVFCLEKAKEDNFLAEIGMDGFFMPPCRRLIVGPHFFPNSSFGPHAQNHHSFICHRLPDNFPFPFKLINISSFGKYFERLRVFSFISAEFEVDRPLSRWHFGSLRCRPSHMEYMPPVHLRYIATMMCGSPDLSRSISNPLNLETLDLKVEKPGDPIELPCDIFKMGKLRHLYSKNGVFMYHFILWKKDSLWDLWEWEMFPPRIEAGVGFEHSFMLDSLQTLHQICACKDCQNFLVRTPNLRKLGLAKNIDLRDDETLDLEFLKCLETLSLSLFIPMARMKLPLTIKRLTLRSTSLKWEELSIFQNLPSLEVLKLGYGACIGPVWNASGEGFPQLKYLRLSHMYDIEEWIADEDHFPKLEELVLEDCSKLEQIPIDFADLNELREIKVTGCIRSLEESAKKIQEEQRNKKGDDDCPNLIVKHNFWVPSDESE